MKAMIFAAGLGTRLRPLTDTVPKALVQIQDTPLLEIVINTLKKNGVTEIIVNVHHFADQVIDFIRSRNNFNIRIEISDERETLLDTGGGLKKASWFFDDHKPFIAHNVDIITNSNIRSFYSWHQKQDALASLIVRERPGKRFLLFDNKMWLCGWENIESGEKITSRPVEHDPSRLAFSSIHVIDPAIFPLMDEEGVFSIRDVYLRLANEHKIVGFQDNDSEWVDVGTPQSLEKGAFIYNQLAKENR